MSGDACAITDDPYVWNRALWLADKCFYSEIDKWVWKLLQLGLKFYKNICDKLGLSLVKIRLLTPYVAYFFNVTWSQKMGVSIKMPNLWKSLVVMPIWIYL